MSAVPAMLETERPRYGLLVLVTAVSLFSLPLMQSLTLQIGFPLKIYEIMLLGAAVILPLTGHLAFPRSAVPMAKITAFWLLMVSILLVFKVTFPPVSMSELNIEGRFGPSGDGITKLVYLFLNLLGFVLFAAQARRDEGFFVRAWLVGAGFAASYEFYLIAANLVGIVEPPMLPNSKGVLFGFGGHLFQRAATFTEGNYAGLYFLLSFLIAMHSGRKRFAAVMIAATITSFSTPAFVCLCGMGGLYAWRIFSKKSSAVKFFLAPAFGLLILVFGVGLAATTLFQATVTSKLTSEEGTGEALSRVERLRAGLGAWQMFVDNPLTGVGVAQFGYNIQYYQPSEVVGKQIPNVVYLEFLSEDGLLVFLVFLYSMWLTYRRTSEPGERYLRIGILSLMLYFVAFPTISIMYIWAFLALIFGRRRGPFVPADANGAAAVA